MSFGGTAVRAVRRVAGWVALCTVAACGGGASAPLNPQIDWVNDPFETHYEGVYLTFSPRVSGTSGHEASCSVTAGSLPKGMVFDPRTCVAKGYPEEAGDFSIQVTLTVDGWGGSVSSTGHLHITGLMVFFQPLVIAHGGPWSPLWNFDTFEPFHGDDAAFPASRYRDFRLADGSRIPTGMRFDPAGSFVGAPTVPNETGTFTILATVIDDGHGSITASSGAVSFVVGPQQEVINYQYGTADGIPHAKVGVPYSITPTISTIWNPVSAYVWQFTEDTQVEVICPMHRLVDAGMSMDAATGTIAGTPATSGQLCIQVDFSASRPETSIVNLAPGRQFMLTIDP